MKNLISLYALIIAILLLVSCSGETQQSDATDTAQSAEDAPLTEEVPPSNKAICVWGKAGLRDKPGRGKDIKYLTTIYFGESVEMLGDSAEIEERVYIKVRLSDGKEGWVYEVLMAQNAELAVASGVVEIYRRPDMMTFSGVNLEKGEIIAQFQGNNPEWKQVVGKERKKKGWIREASSVSSNEIEVKAAILLQRAMEEEDPIKQKEQLELIAANPAFANSEFLNQVNELLLTYTERPELPADQLYINANQLNVRSTPLIETGNVVFQLDEGAVCTILEKGEKIAIDENEDFWYRVEHEGQEGWVFGYYTSKRLSLN